MGVLSNINFSIFPPHRVQSYHDDLVLETVMFEGSTLRGAYSNPDAADNHLQALRATEEVTGYVYFTVEEWESKDVYTPTIRRS